LALLCLPKLTKGSYDFGFVKFGISLEILIISGKQLKDAKILDQETGTIFALSSMSKAFIALTSLV
jgi:hypothetical protein